MASAYVEHWIAGNTAQLSEDEDSEAKSHYQDFSNDSVWEAWKLHARNEVLTSSTKIRCSFLETELIPLVSRSTSLTTEQRVQIFDILTLTYPRYIDFASRNAVEVCLRELINSDIPDSTLVLTAVISWLVKAIGVTGSSRVRAAPANQHVLLSWACIIYGSFFDKIIEISDSLSKKLLQAFAISLVSLLDNSAGVKNSLRNSAIVRSRRAVRRKSDFIPLLIKEQLAIAKTFPTPYIFAPFLGLSIDVALHLRPTKGQDSNFGRSIIEASKNDILAFYGNQVIMARSLMPTHVSDAFRGFFKIIDSNDLKNILLPIIEKAILRSPEYSLSTVADLLDGYGRPLDDQMFSKLCSASLNNAKSANATTRTQSARLFAAIAQYQGDALLNSATTEILTLPCANKTSGVDHRRNLYEMLSSIRPGLQLSRHIVQVLPSLIIRETDETALNRLELILSRHLAYQLQQNQSIDSTITTAFAKEMTSNKPVLRRAFCMIAGNALWPFNTEVTSAATSFREALSNAFDTCYKSVSSNPLALPAGPLEGYVALAILLGSSRENKDILQGILATSSAKPHFLLWQKCYQKLTSVQDEQWFLRALEVVLRRCQSQIESNEVLRSHFGFSFAYLAIESKNLDTRRAVITLVQAHSSKVPCIMNRMIRQTVIQRLNQFQNIEQTEERADIFRRRSEALLIASVTLGDDVDVSQRESIVSQNIVISHHAAIADSSRSLWIELCQKVKVDPRQTIQNHLSDIMSIIWDNTNSLTHSPSIIDAGFQAVTTLVFVEPSIILPAIVQRIRADLDATLLEALTAEDYNMWQTPEGQLYDNVLEKRKFKTVEKGKDSELRKWEAELRKSLANKRPENSSLSKEDQALVNSQLAKESQVRARVTSIKANAEHGLALIQSIIKANVSEFREYITPVIDLLVAGPLSAGSELVGPAAFETYILLANVCSDRLGNFREWIGISTLRCMGVKTTPVDLTAEPVNLLIIRVLYRLKSYTEQSFLDVSTFCYVNPLITRLIETNASNASDADEALEQLTLALDFVKQHCAQFKDDTYPRRTTINNLLHVIRNKPQLAQTAVSCLIDLGSAMHSNPTRDETNDLLQGALSQESLARNACLQVLQTFDLTDIDWLPELWLACHDDDEQCSRLAEFVWEDNGLDVPKGYLSSIITYLAHEHYNVRTSCAYAISEAAKMWPQDAESTVTTLQSFFEEKAKPLAPEFDEYGMVIAETIGRVDPWPARLAVARSFEALAPIFPSVSVVPWFQFLLSGNTALGDSSEEVRKGLLAAGTAVLDAQGFSSLPELIALFEASLQTTNTSKSGDHIKEAAVILFGRLARHLDKSDSRVPMVVDRLVEALKTPSESVQVAVSDCLVPLARMIRPNAARLIDSLFTDMFNAPKYAARRGAAYGLAGIVKGLGISSMKEFNIVERLRAALEDKKKSESRQGALFAFETFSVTLGRLFEPYVIYLVPQLLGAFGDASTDVREATQDAAKVIMGNMSAYGVKLILPSLLSGLDEKQWRTKKGSIDLLGSMAFCSPTQLSLSLPTVIPKLTGVLTDSHAQVRGAANQSLKQFGEVINNPEIQILVPVLLKALSDPAKGPAALSALLKTSFAHYIDSSSLALVIPIIERGLRERSSETKRRAARIVGNMSSLTDPKDFVPYLSRLMPLVHVCLVDPVPEARATAAKALGSLVERLGEVHFPDLVPGLLRTLKSDVSGVDRQGAAQGLSETLSGLGMERLEALLPDIIANASSSKPHVKEGFMSLLVFLPATFGTRFQPHLPKIIQPILNGLADSEEVVREAALKAGRMIIVNYSNRAIDLLLPELETGMFDSSWRIRQSSVTLVGELLFKIAGISGKAEMDDEGEMAVASAADSSRRVLTDLLGPERKDRILAGLYILRQDDISVVRLASIQVWKALVQNTPRTVREMLSSVISQILFLLPKPDSDQEKMAVATIAELCRKLGEKVFMEIIRLLQASSKSSDDRTREATCLALVHILPNTLESHKEGKEDDLIPIVRRSLVDQSANVRSAAAQAFDALQEAYGAKAIDETIPTLLEALRQPDENSDTALKALKEVMNVRANVVFPILIPTLIAAPITAFNARALASLVTVAGSALTKRLNIILEALLKALESPECTIHSEITEALRAIITSVTEDDSLHALTLQLLAWAKDPSPVRRKSTMGVVQLFFSETTADTAYYRLDWLPPLILLLDDGVDDVAHATWDALDAFVKSVPKQELESLVVVLRKNLETIGAPGRFVRGLSIEGPGRGPAPVVPIILAGLTTGTNEQREYAAYAIGDLVHRTSEAALKPFVVPLTGPLIRVATQSASLPPPVKTAILTALTIMLDTISNFVKPFFPQLQRTFIKLLLDTTSGVVRSRAADALGSLVCSLTRIDPVVTELVTMSKSNDEPIAASCILALSNVIKNASQHLGEPSKSAISDLLNEAFHENHEESYTSSTALLFTQFANCFPKLPAIRNMVKSHIVDGNPSMLTSHIIVNVLTHAPRVFHEVGEVESGGGGGGGTGNNNPYVLGVLKKIQISLSESTSISRPAREARELVKIVEPWCNELEESGL